VALYADQLAARLSLAQLRVRFPPRIWRELREVEFEAVGYRCTVELLRVPSTSCHGGRRTFFRCPTCRRQVGVMGCLAGVGWGCNAKECLVWRGRPRRRIELASQKP
jgi:hypothetical protein